MEVPIVKTEKALKLVCNITIETNHLSEGIKIGLEGAIEKHSDVLGRNAQWKKTLRINRLPKYLCVQFMRFYWKLTPESRDHTGVKCKMLRVRGALAACVAGAAILTLLWFVLLCVLFCSQSDSHKCWTYLNFARMN